MGTFYRPQLPKESTLDLPSFTICANPYVNETALKLTGLKSNVWSFFNYEFGDTNFSSWPIKDPIKDLNLYEKSIFSIEEFVQEVNIQIGNQTTYNVSISDLINEKFLKIEVKAQKCCYDGLSL